MIVSVYGYMNTFTIKDLENLSGIKAHTIRIWEQRYSFLKPQRTDTNIRTYSNEELKTILNVALLTKHGFKISHINKMSEEELNRNIASLQDADALQERLIIQMIECMVNLDVAGFESIINHQIKKKGIEKTIQHLIFQFLEKVGILWLTNRINPSQEHLITQLIRQKLIAGIEQTSSSIFTSQKTVLLFLPENEYHELGLLFVHFLMKSRGIQVVYLGANVPSPDVAFVVEHMKPDLLYTHLTCIPGVTKFERYIQNLKNACGNTQLIISGSVVQQTNVHSLPGIKIIHNMSEVISLINSLSISESLDN